MGRAHALMTVGSGFPTRRGECHQAGGERAAIFYSLIRTARLNGVEPEAYLREVIARIGEHPINRIGELLPWNIARPATHSVVRGDLEAGQECTRGRREAWQAPPI